MSLEFDERIGNAERRISELHNRVCALENKEVAPSASSNSAMDAMQRLYDKLASGCNYELFYCYAQSIISEYRAAQHQ